MGKTYTQEEVENIVVATLIFTNSTMNKQLKNVEGESFGQVANSIIEAMNNRPEGESIIAAISRFKKF